MDGMYAMVLMIYRLLTSVSDQNKFIRVDLIERGRVGVWLWTCVWLRACRCVCGRMVVCGVVVWVSGWCDFVCVWLWVCGVWLCG